jgi:hypothetical protein
MAKLQASLLKLGKSLKECGFHLSVKESITTSTLKIETEYVTQVRALQCSIDSFRIKKAVL